MAERVEPPARSMGIPGESGAKVHAATRTIRVSLKPPVLLTVKFVAPSAKSRVRSEGRALVVSGAEPSARPESLEKNGGFESENENSRIFVGRGFSHDIRSAKSVRL